MRVYIVLLAFISLCFTPLGAEESAKVSIKSVSSEKSYIQDWVEFSLSNGQALGLDVGQYTHKELISCMPSLDGVFQYQNENKLLLFSRQLHSGTKYSCTLNSAEITGADASPVTFDSNPFALKHHAHSSSGMVRLEFNDDIDASSVKDAIKTYRTEKLSSSEVPYKSYVEGNSVMLVLKADVNSDLKVQISDSLKSSGGAKLSESSTLEFSSKAAFVDNQDKSPMGIHDEPTGTAFENGEVGIRLFLPDQVNEETIRNYVKIEGVDSFEVSQCYWLSYYEREGLSNKSKYYLDISGDFKSNENYKLALLKGLESGSSQLKTTVYTEVQMPNAKSFVLFESEKPYLSHYGEIGFKSINVNKATVVVTRVLEENYNYFTNFNRADISNINRYSTEVYSKLFTFENNINTWKQQKISIREEMKKWPAGIYQIHVHYGDNSEAVKTVFLSDIGISAKLSRDQLLISAARLSDTAGIANATVKVYSDKNHQIAMAKTGADGVALIDSKNFLLQNPVMVTVQKDQDKNFLLLNSPLNSNTLKLEESDSKLHGYIYLQSRLVRPGSSASMLFVVKDTSYRSAAGLPLRVLIKDPMGQTVHDKAIMLSPSGSGSLDLQIPKAYRTGKYRVEAYFSDRRLASEYFNVETFLPQQIKNSITLEKRDFKLTDAFHADVRSDYLFGAPAASLKAEARLSAVSKHYVNPNYPDYSFVNDLRSEENVVNYLDLQQQFTLDSDGKHHVTFPLGISQRPASILAGQISVTVFDDGRPVSSYEQFDIYPYGFMTGVSTDRKVVESGEKIKIKTLLIDLESAKPVKRPLNVKISRLQWSYNWSNGYEWHKQYKTVSEQQVDAGTSIEKSFDHSGTYLIEVSDMAGGHSATTTFNVSGWDYDAIGPSNDLQKNQVEFEAKAYRKGDHLKAAIKSPLIKGRLLVTLEGEKVLWRKVFAIENGSASVNIPLDFDLGSGVYLATSVVSSTDTPSELQSFRASSRDYIRVDKSDKRLNVEIVSADQTKSKRSMHIKVKSAPGSEVLVSVVDEGILQLARQTSDDIFSYFDIKPDERVGLYDIYDQVMHQRTEGSILRFGGDDSGRLAGQQKHLSPDTGAERVKPFIFWSGLLMANSKGEVETTLEIPEFNGKARITAIAMNIRGVGSGTKAFTVKDEVMIKPSYPRFLHVGDKVVIPVRVFNTTAKDMDISLSVSSSESVEVEGGTEPVKVAAKSSLLTTLNAEAVQLGKAEITVTATLQELEFVKNMEFPVYFADPLVTETFRGETKERAEFTVPSTFFGALNPKAKITVSESYLSQFNTDVDDLVNYPHGCVEQTSSKILAMHYIDIFVKGASEAHKEQILKSKKHFIDQGIYKLRDMQQPNGKFAYWERNGYVNDFASVYSADVLLSIVDSTTRLDPDMKSKIISGLKSYSLANENRLVKMYASYLLARENSLDASRTNALFENEDYKFNIVTATMMAAILKLSGDQKALTQVFDYIDDQFDGSAVIERKYGDSFDSAVRDHAFALYLYSEHFGKDARAYKLLEMMSSKISEIYSTQDKAFVMRALVSYYGDDHAELDATLHIGQQSADYKEQTIVERELESPDISVVSNNGGSVNYSVEVSQFLPKELKNTLPYYFKKQIRLYRAYVDRNGHQIELDNLAVGDKIYSKIALITDDNYENIVVIDRIPACFEIVNERTGKSSRPDAIKDLSFSPDYQDIRDDQVITYLDSQTGKIIVFYRPLRVVSEGECQLPAALAEVMYDPRINDHDKQAYSFTVKSKRTEDAPMTNQTLDPGHYTFKEFCEKVYGGVVKLDASKSYYNCVKKESKAK